MDSLAVDCLIEWGPILGKGSGPETLYLGKDVDELGFLLGINKNSSQISLESDKVLRAMA